jgi:hypothetical protein
MTRLLVTSAAAAALAASVPFVAQGQTYMDTTGTAGIQNRIVQLQTRIDAGIRSGAIDRREARRLRSEMRALNALEYQYRAGGLNREERAELRERVRLLRQNVRTADNGAYDRFERRADWAEFDGRASAGLSFEERLDQLEARIEAGVDSGAIGTREARGLRRQLDDLDALESRYAAGGLSAEEQRDLQLRLREVRREVRMADRGAYDRYEDGDAWAEYDDGYDGRGGPYEGDGWVVAADSQPRSGVAGIFDALLGRNTLRVGQRVSGNLYAVPGEYRDQFRDNGDVYFRSDGMRIYEIDADTDMVVRIYVRAE